jgi:hypothetical protein
MRKHVSILAVRLAPAAAAADTDDVLSGAVDSTCGTR